jgi:hypothetical protein
LLIACRLNFGDGNSYDALDVLSNDVGKMLIALNTYLTREIGSNDPV